MIKNLLKLSIVVFLCLGLVGCVKDKLEINDRAFVLAIGFDRDKDTGGLNVTVQMPILAKLGGGGGGEEGKKGGGEGAVLIVSGKGETVHEAINDIQAHVEGRLFFGQLRVIAVSEELAKEGIKGLLDPFLRDRTVTRRAVLTVTKGEAGELVNVQSKTKKIPAEALVQLFKTRQQIAKEIVTDIGKFSVLIQAQGEEPAVTVVKPMKDHVEIEGLATFKGDKLVGFLHEEEVPAITFLKGRGQEYRFSFTCPLPDHQGTFSVMTTEIRPKIKTNLQDGQIAYDVNIVAKGRLLAHTCPQAGILKPDEVKQYEEIVAQGIKEKVEGLIGRLQIQNSDILGFGEMLREEQPHIWETINWDEVFPTVKVNVHTDFILNGTGILR